jgi:pyruvate-ferredoxin/flavodoxin oxidoreductase
VLDHLKEPGSLGEPLFLDVLSALAEANAAGTREIIPVVTGGGTGYPPGVHPGHGHRLFDLAADRRTAVHHQDPDDVSGLSLDYDPDLDIEPPGRSARFFGRLDRTVSANKNTIKILGADEY